ncbi:Uncharacterised protein [Mycoplasmopsis maculosa]|uniref:Uncharacterized protein n=1 Tax=Mycoplasmopsis maculosa TaxID=114885 RepID=A0A449B4E0_9BACT|nr:hypothetical protein [Mycoplasmopsis maculosa]VEU75439.1 Uncharacterised protein [Mycoplasmopsis maculosa]
MNTLQILQIILISILLFLVISNTIYLLLPKNRWYIYAFTNSKKYVIKHKFKVKEELILHYKKASLNFIIFSFSILIFNIFASIFLFTLLLLNKEDWIIFISLPIFLYILVAIFIIFIFNIKWFVGIKKWYKWNKNLNDNSLIEKTIDINSTEKQLDVSINKYNFVLSKSQNKFINSDMLYFSNIYNKKFAKQPLEKQKIIVYMILAINCENTLLLEDRSKLNINMFKNVCLKYKII